MTQPHQHKPVKVIWQTNSPLARIGDVVSYCPECKYILGVESPHPDRGKFARAIAALKLWLKWDVERTEENRMNAVKATKEVVK